MSNKRIYVRRERRRQNTLPSSGSFNFAQDSYLERTSRPICAIVFLLPFIALYEIGTIMINTDILSQTQVRVVAFVWIQNILGSIGFHGRNAFIAAPLAVILILFAWQIASKRKWNVNWRDMLPMGIECIVFAIPLIVLSLLLNRPGFTQHDYNAEATGGLHTESVISCSSQAPELSAPSTGSGQVEQINPIKTIEPQEYSLFANIITGIGAGIYEELVFRLILICLLMLFFQDVLRLEFRGSIILAVIVSAALFSAHHNIIVLNGEVSWVAPFGWPIFVFRTLAGVYFAVIYSIRGFGITAGIHAFYDIMVAMINSAGKN